MLQKKHRLAKSKDIKNTSARGRSFFSPNFVVKFHPQPTERTSSRVAIVVSNYVSKKAVERNRIKRLIREQVRRHLPKLKLGDYVIIVRPKAKLADEAAITDGLPQLLRSLKLLQ